MAERAHPPRRGQGARQLRRARGGRARRLRPGRRARERVARLTEALAIRPERIVRRLYSDRLLGAAALMAARAPGRWSRAHAPYSRFRVGAALRAEDGAAPRRAPTSRTPRYPQGQCAEASAIGALVAAGRTRMRGGGGDLRRRRTLCVPCGGCRPAAARVHARPARRDPPRARADGARRDADARRAARALASAEFLPRPDRETRSPRAAAPRLGVGASGPASAAWPTRWRTPSRSPTPSCRSFPRPSVHGPRRAAARRRQLIRRLPVVAFRAAQAPLRGRRPGRDARCPVRALMGGRRGALFVTNAAGLAARPSVGPGIADGDQRPHQPARRQPAHRPERRRARPALPEPARRLRPGAARRQGAAAERRWASALGRGRLPGRPRSELRDPGRDPRLPHARRRRGRHVDRPRGDPRASLPACASPRCRRSPTSPRAWAARRSATSRRCATPRPAARLPHPR